MKKESIRAQQKSSVDYDVLEGWARGRMQEVIRELLEEEVEELLGRQRYERKKVENATAVIWKTLLNAPELLKEVCEGMKFVDGVGVTKKREAAA